MIRSLFFPILLIFILSCNSAKNSELILGNWECTNGRYLPPMQLHVTKSYFIYRSVGPAGVRLEKFAYRLANKKQIIATDPNGISYKYTVELLDRDNFRYAGPSGLVVTFKRL